MTMLFSFAVHVLMGSISSTFSGFTWGLLCLVLSRCLLFSIFRITLTSSRSSWSRPCSKPFDQSSTRFIFRTRVRVILFRASHSRGTCCSIALSLFHAQGTGCENGESSTRRSQECAHASARTKRHLPAARALKRQSVGARFVAVAAHHPLHGAGDRPARHGGSAGAVMSSKEATATTHGVGYVPAVGRRHADGLAHGDGVSRHQEATTALHEPHLHHRERSQVPWLLRKDTRAPESESHPSTPRRRRNPTSKTALSRSNGSGEHATDSVMTESLVQSQWSGECGRSLPGTKNPFPGFLYFLIPSILPFSSFRCRGYPARHLYPVVVLFPDTERPLHFCTLHASPSGKVQCFAAVLYPPHDGLWVQRSRPVEPNVWIPSTFHNIFKIFHIP